MNEIIENSDLVFSFLAVLPGFLMIPGIAFFYGGRVEKKNSLTMMSYSFLSVTVITVLWVLWGFSMVFGEDFLGLTGHPGTHFMLQGLGLEPMASGEYASPLPLLFISHLIFACIASAFMSGAVMNRMKIGGWIKFIVLWNLLVYFPIAHWVWGSGFLSKWGFVDYSGGAVVHISAGFGALALVKFLGKRTFILPHSSGSVTRMLIGASLLLFGWSGLSVGGALSTGATALNALLNMIIASAFASVVGVVIRYQKEHRFSFEAIFTGALSGLVIIAPSSGFVNAQVALLLGLLAPFITYYSALFAQKMRWDDPLGVWCLHGMCGFAGTLLTGFFFMNESGTTFSGTHQVFIQLLGALFVGAYSFIITSVLLQLIDLISPVRISDAVQFEGLDHHYLKEGGDSR